MKRNDIKALTDLSLDELQAKLVKLQLELSQKRIEKQAMKLTNVTLIPRLGDDVARLKTVISIKLKESKS